MYSGSIQAKIEFDQKVLVYTPPPKNISNLIEIRKVISEVKYADGNDFSLFYRFTHFV
jgi:hypothetical protein